MLPHPATCSPGGVSFFSRRVVGKNWQPRNIKRGKRQHQHKKPMGPIVRLAMFYRFFASGSF